MKLHNLLLIVCLAATPLAAQVEGAPHSGDTPPSNEVGDAPSAQNTGEPSSGDDPTAEAYLLKCAGCHTVGQGKLNGPDLITSITWPDTDLATGIQRMEPKTGPLDPTEVAALVKLLKDAGLTQRLEAQSARIAQRFAAKLDAPDAALGRQLYSGEQPFARGGMSCAACHRADGVGGNLGPDLTDIFSKLGKIGLMSACESTNFPVMRTAYENHPITKQEALHLAHYLESIVNNEPTPAGDNAVLVWGAALALLVGVAAARFRTPKQGVRASLVRASYGGKQ